MAANRRIQKEWADLQADPVPGVAVAPDESNMLKCVNQSCGSHARRWAGYIEGPPGTPYAGGKWKISIDYPLEFPFKAPVVKFHTRIYHCNITDDGGICIGMLKAESWKPSTKTRAILQALVQLLSEPNSTSQRNADSRTQPTTRSWRPSPSSISPTRRSTTLKPRPRRRSTPRRPIPLFTTL